MAALRRLHIQPQSSHKIPQFMGTRATCETSVDSEDRRSFEASEDGERRKYTVVEKFDCDIEMSMSTKRSVYPGASLEHVRSGKREFWGRPWWKRAFKEMSFPPCL